MGIPQKLIRLIRMITCQTNARAKTDNQISAPIEFNKGIKQGDALSTALFMLALHNAAQETDQRGTIYTKSSQVCVYANDVVIVTGTETGLRQVCREIEEKTQQRGIIVKEERTKYKVVSASQKGRQTQNWKA